MHHGPSPDNRGSSCLGSHRRDLNLVGDWRGMDCGQAVLSPFLKHTKMALISVMMVACMDSSPRLRHDNHSTQFSEGARGARCIKCINSFCDATSTPCGCGRCLRSKGPAYHFDRSSTMYNQDISLFFFAIIIRTFLKLCPM